MSSPVNEAGVLATRTASFALYWLSPGSSILNIKRNASLSSRLRHPVHNNQLASVDTLCGATGRALGRDGWAMMHWVAVLARGGARRTGDARPTPTRLTTSSPRIPSRRAFAPLRSQLRSRGHDERRSRIFQRCRHHILGAAAQIRARADPAPAILAHRKRKEEAGQRQWQRCRRQHGFV